MNIIIELFIFKIVKVPHLSLSWQFWFFVPNLPEKSISSLKNIKWTTPLNSVCSNQSRYQMSLSTNNFDQICPKRIFLVKIRESEHRHWILHIRINQSTAFQLKLTILILWFPISKKKKKKKEEFHLNITIFFFRTKFTQKGYLQFKQDKINTTTEFYIFELV